MLIHFLNEYNIDGRMGDRIKIRGVFPGIKESDFVFLNSTQESEDESAYKIEEIQYLQDYGNAFTAIITAA